MLEYKLQEEETPDSSDSSESTDVSDEVPEEKSAGGVTGRRIEE